MPSREKKPPHRTEHCVQAGAEIGRTQARNTKGCRSPSPARQERGVGPSLRQPADTSTLDFRLQNSGTPDCCCGLPPTLPAICSWRAGSEAELRKDRGAGAEAKLSRKARRSQRGPDPRGRSRGRRQNRRGGPRRDGHLTKPCSAQWERWGRCCPCKESSFGQTRSCPALDWEVLEEHGGRLKAGRSPQTLWPQRHCQ